jgi:NADP-dependent 3-hydroxy acid dehydrogenase YdfG
MQKAGKKRPLRKPQSQPRPGLESKMKPEPLTDLLQVPSRKLLDKKAFITGGDSGIGRAVAVLFAKEGADVAIAYLNEDKDAEDTQVMVEQYGRQCLLLPGDLSKESNCKRAVAKAVRKFGQIDILVNNAAIHMNVKSSKTLQRNNCCRLFQPTSFHISG